MSGMASPRGTIQPSVVVDDLKWLDALAAGHVALLDYSRRQLERLFDRRRVASEP